VIPRILHYVWVGGPLPDKQRAYIDSWRATNPDFQVMAWNETNIDMREPLIRDAYAARKWAKVADVARLMAVQQYGGIYLDTDFKVFKPLDPLLQHTCFFAFQETDSASSDLVCNGVFGAVPDHWFVRDALATLLAKKRDRILPEKPTSFGPKHITRLLRQHGLEGYSSQGVDLLDIHITPVPVFFPFSAEETFTPECIRKETLAAHFWEKSWEASVPQWVRWAKRAKTIIAPHRG
jgi:hypothetical protein